jgi:hypothetical protein
MPPTRIELVIFALKYEELLIPDTSATAIEAEPTVNKSSELKY